MTYRHRNRKIPYSKMSIEKLRQIEADISKKNPNLEDRLRLFREEEKRLSDLKEAQQNLQNRISEIRGTALKRKEEGYAAAGFLKRLFTTKTSPDYTESERAELDQLEKIRDRKYRVGYDRNKYRFEFEAHERLEKIRKLIDQKDKRETKRSTDRAVIAAYKGKSRRLADQVKSDLREQMNIDPHCPYCGNNMAGIPHCDHVYPVSKGGFSTPRNMVYVCADCNTKKTDLTLTQFIKKYSLQRSEIEQRLEKLGKDY